MKSTLTKLMAFVIAAAMLLSVVACSKTTEPTTTAPSENAGTAAGEKDYTKGDSIVIKYCTTTADNQPSAHFGFSLRDKLNELTNGRIKVEVYTNSQMGKASELLEGLQLGTIEMTCSTSANLGGFTDAVALFDLPYLFANGEAANEVIDGEVGDQILAELEPSGFHGLAWVTGRTELWRLLTANKEIHVPSDLGGIKLRVMNNAIHETTWNTLGASAVPMAFSELYTALQNHTVDAQENPWGQIQGSKLYEVQKYIIKTEHSFDFSPVLISKVFWDGLTDLDREVIQLACDQIVPGEREYTDQLQRDAEKEATDYGCIVIELTPEEKAEWVKLGRSIYPKFADKVGQARIDKCLEVSAKYENSK